jgi:indole-3-glycerol phosphate synthase
VLFKEFVLDPVQLSLASAMGAHMVLLLVRALPGRALAALVEATLAQGMCPVVEAADERELELALATAAPAVGVNARDLRTFRVDTERALLALSRVPPGRIAVHMSGVATAEDLARVAESRADAVLIGEALMRAPVPGDRLAALIAQARSMRQ